MSDAMPERRGAVVVGGSSGVGRALADALARAGYDLVVAARRQKDLDAVAADLRLRHGVAVTPLAIDLLGTDEELEDWFEKCRASLARIDAVLITAGMVDDGDDGVSSWTTASDLLTTNYTAVTKLAGSFITTFEQDDRGSLILFSSIAAHAPRQRNVAYAAAKTALESYARSMQHRLAGTAVSVQVYVLGYVDTAMSRGRRLMLPAVAPERVADEVVGHLTSSRRFRYFPRYWGTIMFGVKLVRGHCTDD